MTDYNAMSLDELIEAEKEVYFWPNHLTAEIGERRAARDAILDMAERLDAEGLSVQPNALVDKAEVFRVSRDITVERRGEHTWVVRRGSAVLNTDWEFEYEPMPSNRTDDFISRTRFSIIDAFQRAQRAAAPLAPEVG